MPADPPTEPKDESDAEGDAEPDAEAERPALPRPGPIPPEALQPTVPGPGATGMRTQFLTPRPPLNPGAGVRVYPPSAHPAAAPAQWAPDPGGRHQWRWWDGWRWTDQVADDGETDVDPLE